MCNLTFITAVNNLSKTNDALTVCSSAKLHPGYTLQNCLKHSPKPRYETSSPDMLHRRSLKQENGVEEVYSRLEAVFLNTARCNFPKLRTVSVSFVFLK
jgi:hypothetical protein